MLRPTDLDFLCCDSFTGARAFCGRNNRTSFHRPYGITVILMRFHFDARKSGRLRANPKRGVGFEEAQEMFSHPYYLDQRSDLPEQYRAVGWVGGDLYTVIFEVREDKDGEYYHMVTLWKATKQEQKLYAEHS